MANVYEITKSQIMNQGKNQTSSLEKHDGVVVEIPDAISVRELANMLQVSAVEVIRRLMKSGVMANINQVINYQTAARVSTDLGFEVRHRAQLAEGAVRERKRGQGAGKHLQPRPPVVVIMGHVDHGKTRLLDTIRQTNVMASEAGAITQHIGASQVEFDGKKITFLDTPGHEAFTAMRARGARVADIAIIVVAADDGVMPQTLEAIDHSRAAGLVVLVAINKIDKPNANLEMVKKQLAEAGLQLEERGGDTICVPVSAKEKTGISDLLESLLLLAELEELVADTSRPAEGVVIEARLDRSMGPMATVLVRNGILRIGEAVVAGFTYGKVKAMFNDRGKRVTTAEPSDPVQLIGLNSVPEVGDILTAVFGEKEAQILSQRRVEERESAPAGKSASLVDLFSRIQTSEVKELKLILKTDVQGSIEPIKASLEHLSTDEVAVRILRSATGNITETDVMLAAASQGLVIGFGVGTEIGAQKLAEKEGVEIRTYDVIYELVDEVEKALKGVLIPKTVEVIEGRGEVIATFPIRKGGRVAGVRVTEGKVRQDASVRIMRRGKVISESVVTSLKRYQDTVKEVLAGLEAGVGVKGFKDFEIGDIVEFYRIEKTYGVSRK